MHRQIAGLPRAARLLAPWAGPMLLAALTRTSLDSERMQAASQHRARCGELSGYVWTGCHACGFRCGRVSVDWRNDGRWYRVAIDVGLAGPSCAISVLLVTACCSVPASA